MHKKHRAELKNQIFISSRPGMFCKKGCSQKFRTACSFIKKETLTQVLSCEFFEISKNTFLTEHLRRLLPKSLVISNLKRQFGDTLLEKCLSFSNLSVYSRIRIEYEEIRSISAYSVRMRKYTDQKNSEYRHFSRSDIAKVTMLIYQCR